MKELTREGELCMPEQGEPLEIVPCLEAGDDDGDDNEDTSRSFYRLHPTIGDGALLVDRLRLKAGPLGALARALEVMLEALYTAESRALLEGGQGLLIALGRILMAAHTTPAPEARLGELRADLEALLARFTADVAYQLDLEEEPGDEEQAEDGCSLPRR